MKNLKLIFSSLLFLLMLCSINVYSQPANPNPPGVPIDGGVGALIAAGAAYGVKKRREMIKKKDGLND